MLAYYVIPVILLLIVLTGCTAGEREHVEALRYFSSPEQAVEETSRLLREENWHELASYYDLTGTDIDRSELESGRLFIRTERPESTHPAGFWRYREPFPPGFLFDRVETTDDPNVLRVDVSIAIDQGNGPPQIGMDNFLLRRSDAGYQLLPK